MKLRQQIEALATATREAAAAAREAGEKDLALDLYAGLERVDGWLDGRRLPVAEDSANLQPVTGEQLQRRGRAIAKAKAAKSDDPLWSAITKSKWGSQETYAKKRLKVSPGSLSAYRSGGTPCPRRIADVVKADFDIGYDYWRGGVVE